MLDSICLRFALASFRQIKEEIWVLFTLTDAYATSCGLPFLPTQIYIIYIYIINCVSCQKQAKCAHLKLQSLPPYTSVVLWFKVLHPVALVSCLPTALMPLHFCQPTAYALLDPINLPSVANLQPLCLCKLPTYSLCFLRPC